MMLIVQTAGAQEFFSSASDFARLYIGAVEPQYQTAQWHDIPYYKGTTDLYKGRVCYDGVVYDDVQLRFDQLEQRVVVLSPVGSVVCVPQQEHIDWFEMDGHRYVYEGSHYAAVLCDGKGANGNAANGIRLYHSYGRSITARNCCLVKRTRSGRLTNYPTEPNSQYLVYHFPE